MQVGIIPHNRHPKCGSWTTGGRFHAGAGLEGSLCAAPCCTNWSTACWPIIQQPIGQFDLAIKPCGRGCNLL